jgi:hypothetical protein
MEESDGHVEPDLRPGVGCPHFIPDARQRSTTRAVPPYQPRRREAARTRATAVDKGHGRRERRTVIASTELTAYLRPLWEDLGQVDQITRERRGSDGTTIESAYRITRLKPEQADAGRLLELDRGHWGIENGLHHVRDVSLGEDACRVRSGDAAQLLAAARNLTLGLLRLMGFPSIAAGTRRIVMHPIEGLQRMAQRIWGEPNGPARPAIGSGVALLPQRRFSL